MYLFQFITLARGSLPTLIHDLPKWPAEAFEKKPTIYGLRINPQTGEERKTLQLHHCQQENSIYFAFAAASKIGLYTTHYFVKVVVYNFVEFLKYFTMQKSQRELRYFG